MNSNNMGIPESSFPRGVSDAEKLEDSLASDRFPKDEVSVEELTRFLKENGVDTSAWGTGEAKTVGDLLQEMSKGESQLLVFEEGLRRVTSVVGIDVLYVSKDGRKFRLKEEGQVFRDGRRRVRNLPRSMGEKIEGGESSVSAAVRGVRQELQIEIGLDKLASLGQENTELMSPSYPGLVTRYNTHIFELVLSDEEYRPSYEEDDGNKITTFIWEEVVE